MTDKQQSMFLVTADGRSAQIRPHFADADDTPRLTGQNAQVLDRLRNGPATNRELAAISLKYTGRISDVRDYLKPRGYTIVCRKGSGGLNTYEIIKTTT